MIPLSNPEPQPDRHPELHADQEPRKVQSWRAAWALAMVIGVLFALPHAVRIVALGSYAAYSPFTAHSPSPMVFDETFLYAAEANHLLTRGGAMAYDDTWEYRSAVYPYSVLPTAIEAGLAFTVRSLKLAHMLLSFVFPTLSALLLMAVFKKVGAGRWLAAVLAIFVLVGAFSPLTFELDVLAFLHHAHGARAFDTLQAARMPNPAMTFLQFAAALVLLTKVLLTKGVLSDGLPARTSHGAPQRQALPYAAGAGLLGGLLYFSYIYYAITWTLLLCLLAAVSLLRQRLVPRTVWLPLAVTAVFALLFLLWKHVSVAQGNYELRAARIGLYHSHAFEPNGLVETWFWGAQALLCAAVWLGLRRARSAEPQDDARWVYADALMPVLLAGMVSALAGMNMQVLTGFNLQQVQHYPHMILQPLGFIMMGVLMALVYPKGRAWKGMAAAVFVLALGLSALAQVEAARDTAQMHALPPAERMLFAWLNANSPAGSVVATDDLALSIVLPVQTHNSVLFADGSRSSAPDEELMERFLLASRLAGAPPSVVELKLAGEMPPGEMVTVADYPLYLFEFSRRYQRILAERRVAPDRMAAVMREYAAMNLGLELQRFRVDYLWIRSGAQPAPVDGWIYAPVLSTDEGNLWRLTRQ